MRNKSPLFDLLNLPDSGLFVMFRREFIDFRRVNLLDFEYEVPRMSRLVITSSAVRNAESVWIPLNFINC